MLNHKTIPVDIGIFINLTFVIDNVTEVEFVAIIAKVSIVFSVVEKVLIFFPFLLHDTRF